jgi:hypothetical protein
MAVSTTTANNVKRVAGFIGHSGVMRGECVAYSKVCTLSSREMYVRCTCDVTAM